MSGIEIFAQIRIWQHLFPGSHTIRALSPNPHHNLIAELESLQLMDMCRPLYPVCHVHPQVLIALMHASGKAVIDQCIMSIDLIVLLLSVVNINGQEALLYCSSDD